MFTVILYYKYVHIENPEALAVAQRTLCEKLGLKGRLLIAHEGLNGTLEGSVENIEKYIAHMSQDPRFVDIHWKKSIGNGNSFPKLKVKARSEIVTTMLGAEDIDPTKITGKYITTEELHEWMWGEHECNNGNPSTHVIRSGTSNNFSSELVHSGSSERVEELPQRINRREFYIVDMRNDFEQKVGYFENSIFPGMSHFRDLKSILPKLRHLKDKTIVTVCTGGVRCEKASGFLVSNGFTDVYQLQGGIVTYMEKYPNLDFKGKLYVFDNRIIMEFNTDDTSYQIVGLCERCKASSEQYVNCKNTSCNAHFILCLDCSQNGTIYCPNCYNSFVDSV